VGFGYSANIPAALAALERIINVNSCFALVKKVLVVLEVLTFVNATAKI